MQVKVESRWQTRWFLAISLALLVALALAAFKWRAQQNARQAIGTERLATERPRPGWRNEHLSRLRWSIR